MPRCFLPALALPRAGSAVFTMATLALALGTVPAIAQNAASTPASRASAPPPPPPVDPNLVVPLQLSRVLPPTSLRGEVLFSQPPNVVLNGKTNARLAPGARIRAENNLLVMWNVLVGKKLKVNYTIDSYGLLMDVWILRNDELAQLWPTSAEQAAKWTYDPIKKTWSK
ncbi:MAG TPA: hypothetical protein H9903_12935 [Candidatus Aquabacterium excrementipullorum]|nr:hypothetical protein [Candidatus Aquabacterium excrementipullorum]